MIPLSRNQIAELRGIDPTTVSRYNLPHTKVKQKNIYDLTDPQVWEFVTYNTVKDRVKELRNKTELESEDDELLKKIKTQEQIEKIRKENRKLDLQHEITARNLVPKEQIDYYLGEFAEGINNNFLTIPNRIGKGNPKLRDHIAAEIKKSIEKTLSSAGKALSKHSEEMINTQQDER